MDIIMTDMKADEMGLGNDFVAPIGMQNANLTAKIEQLGVKNLMKAHCQMGGAYFVFEHLKTVNFSNADLQVLKKKYGTGVSNELLRRYAIVCMSIFKDTVLFRCQDCNGIMHRVHTNKAKEQKKLKKKFLMKGEKKLPIRTGEWNTDTDLRNYGERHGE